MKASETLFNTFLSQNKTQFVIPVYQRNYDWSTPQCEQLLQDILEVGTKSGDTHFIGSIVYIHDGVFISSEVKPLVIIDGQQRLTTLTLLYLALHKFASKAGNAEKADEIQDTFLQNKYVKTESNKLKLKQAASNYGAFKHLYDGQEPSTFREYSKVIDNYLYFYQQINEANFTTLLEGLSRLLFVEVSLERGKDDPQKIFESLNSTGLELSQSDLIRNYILMGLEPEMQERVFEQQWKHIEIEARDIDLQESRVSDFIRDYLTLKSKRIPNKGKVYEEFKKKYSIKSEDFYKTILPEIKLFASHYGKLLNPQLEPDVSIRKDLTYIKRLEINVAYPFLVQVYHDYATNVISAADFVRVLKVVQTFAWRRFILSLPPGAHNKIFMTLYSDVDQTNYVESIEVSLARRKGSARFPTDQEITEVFADKDFYNIYPKNRAYLFDRMENHSNSEPVDVENPDITIEHIFPQNPDSMWETELSQSDYTLFKEKYLHTIGNLTLSGNNGRLSNKPYSEKKIMKKDNVELGYNYSRLWLNRYLRETDRWSVENMQQRSKVLLQRFFEIWPYPQVDLDQDYDLDEEFNIYDAPDPKYRKLDYFIFKNEKVVEEEVSKMYYHVLRTLMNENAELFHSPEISGLISYSANPEDLRTPVLLQAPYYIEGNVNSTEKFRKLKRVMERYGCADELLINYANDDSTEVVRDRAYWEAKTSPATMNFVDQLFSLVVEITPDAVPNYNNNYVGIAINGNAQNYVVFAAKQEYIRVEIVSADVTSTINKLRSAGMDVLGVGKRSNRIKFRMAANQLEANKELLRVLFREAERKYFG